MKYKVQWDYSSSIGAFDKGTTVEVDDALAEHVNRDSPGVLAPVKEKQTKKPNVADVIASVGDDVDKAVVALEAENASDKPRPTLIEALTEIVEGGNGDD